MRQFLLSGGYRGERPGEAKVEDRGSPIPDWNRAGVRVHARSAEHAVVEADVLDFLACLPDNSIPLILTDPPYASGGATTVSRKAAPAGKYGLVQSASFEGDQRDQRSFTLWTREWMRLALRKARPDGGVLAVFCDWRQFPTVSDCLQVSGWTWRGCVCWDKRGAGRGLLWGFRNTFEFILWASHGAPPDRGSGWPSAKPAVIRASGVRKRVHMTEKPVAVLREIIAQVPAERGPVVDPFVGSGATLAACAELGRPAFGADSNPAFVRAAGERLGLSGE